MDSAIQILLSWQFLILCLGVASVTFVFRKLFDFLILKYFKNGQKFWSEVAVPILPVVVGGCIAKFVEQYPYPEDINTQSGKMFFGLIAGMFSGLVYRVAKSYLSKIGSQSKNNE